ncbi:hypothetical protein Bca4012_095483 [Brassica carinata]
MVFVPVPFCLLLLVLHFHEHTNVMDTRAYIYGVSEFQQQVEVADTNSQSYCDCV